MGRTRAFAGASDVRRGRGSGCPRLGAFLLLAASTALLAGCYGSESEFRFNAVYLKKQEDTAHTQLTAIQRQDITDALTVLFGTPEDPRWPAFNTVDLDRLLDLDRLRMAAGSAGRDRRGRARGLDRKHCVRCHGTSGDGAGPNALLLDPYPRDYRRGIFKFKSTIGISTPPTDADLKSVLKNGIPGTAMPSFRQLADEELDALVQYVKYLSIRGEVERSLIFESVDQLDEYDHLVDMSLEDSDPEELAEQMAYVQSMVADVARKWLEAPNRIRRVPPRPEGWDLDASIERGRQLFYGDVANCAKCHTDEAGPRDPADDYDDWTKEIFDPRNLKAGAPYLAVGALPPRKIRPRNLRRGVYRGGGRPEDLYRRIRDGIAGTPMPAAAMKPEGAAEDDPRLAPEDIWHLVDYVRSLPTARAREHQEASSSSTNAIAPSVVPVMPRPRLTRSRIRGPLVRK